MPFLLEPLLPGSDAERLLQQRLDAPPESWRPGQETAGWHARTVKNKRQLVQTTAFPRRIHGLLFGRRGLARATDTMWTRPGWLADALISPSSSP